MKNKKIIYAILLLIVVIAIIITILIINNKKEKPQDILNTYISLLNEQNYEGLYDLISKTSQEKITKEDFITRNEKIYNGIDAYSIKIDIQEVEKNKNDIKINYNESMSTSAGEVKFSNTANIVKEDNSYKLQWSSKMILPYLSDTDKVRVSTIKASRGEILDRNGKKLAENGTISSCRYCSRKIRRK